MSTLNGGPGNIREGLVFYLDAANPASYLSGSNVAYSLVLSASYQNPVSCSLSGSVDYLTANNGFFRMNGTTSRILIENTPVQVSGIYLGGGTTPWMVNTWIKTSAAGNNTIGGAPIISNRSGGPVTVTMGISTNGAMKYAHYSASWFIESGSRVINDNRWHMVTWVNRNNNTLDMYVDGMFDKNVSSSISLPSSPNPVDIIGASFSTYLNADIATLTINIGPLFTADQILQNYNAQKSRFGL